VGSCDLLEQTAGGK